MATTAPAPMLPCGERPDKWGDHATIVCADTARITRPDWLELRRQGIGSSDAATTLDLNPWDCQYRLMATRKHMMPDAPETERQRWGRLHEPTILAEWRERLDHQRPTVRTGLMLRSVEHPVMLANPDALPSGEQDDAVVEVKTADKFDRARWEDGVPDHYVIQGHHLMIVCGRRRCIYPVLFGGNELIVFEVAFDEEIADRLIEAEARFWHRVETTDWPDPDGSEASMLALRARYLEWTPGVTVELPHDFGQMLTLREALAEQAASATKEIDRIKALVMAEMGTAEVATILGEKVATWRATKAGTRRFTWSH